MTATPDLSAFLDAARTVCGSRYVESAKDMDTSGAMRSTPAVVYPANTDEIKALLALSRTHRVAVHPVSTGRNWGYGGSAAVDENNVIINLSRMTQIIAYDDMLGTVTVEPGVTQGQLSEFLIGKGDKFAGFVTGSSPDCSMIGNALERGYGGNPPTDHFDAVLSLKALLPDGTDYQPLMAELGAGQADALYKWGVGPYLDGLFSQSGLGIVTQMTLLLSPQPEETALMLFKPHKDTRLAELTDMARDIGQTASSCVTSLKIMNNIYFIALGGMHLKKGEEFSPQAFEKLGAKIDTPTYKLVVMLAGTKRQINATLQDIRQVTKGRKGSWIALRETKVTKLINLLSGKPFSWVIPKFLRKQLDVMKRSYDFMRGRPSERMIELAYWKQPKPPQGQRLHPAQDGCGLLWIPLIAPNRGAEVESLHQEISAKVWAAGLEPMLGITHINRACSIMLYGLIYDRAQYEDKVRGLRDEITALALTRGLMPYRLHIDEIAGLPPQGAALEMMRAIKARFDPDNLVSPKRYN